MLSWLRGKLKRWLIEEEQSDNSLFVRYRRDDQVIEEIYDIVGSVGMCLVGRLVKGRQQVKIIEAHEAVDQKKFWRLWQARNPHGGFRWPDGKRFTPGE